MTLAEFAKSKNFPVHPCDDQWHRWDRGGKDNAYWKSLTYHLSDKTLVIVTFGDWKTGEEYQWRDYDPAALSPADLTLVKEADAKAAEAKRMNQERVAGECQKKWEGLTDRGASAYLERKGLHGLYGCRLMAGKTYMPLRDVDGKLWSLQELHLGGLKILTEKGRKKGCFHTLGEIPPEGDVYVAEGLSTGASIHEASGKTVIVAIDAGNLKAVAEALRAKYPDLGLTFCADHDVSGRGLEGAEKARQAVGGQIRMPKEAGQDFNDLHVAAGLEEVRRQLEATPPEPRRGVRTANGDIQPIPTRCNKQGNPVAPTQQRVADHLLDFFNGALVKQGRDLFRYEGTHWVLLEQADLDRVKVLIQRACSGLADVRTVDACYKLFIYHLPSVPTGLDLFTPVPNAANFTNGTLWAEKRGDRYELSFRPHRPEDFLINVLPYEYKPWRELPESPEFQAMLGRVFDGNPDAPVKVAAVRQMYGACLMPIRPHLFMLHGPPGTGKSTVLKVAARLVAKENISSVAPSDFHGFNMETMAGKLVNIDTDIPFNEPIHDEIVKKIEDRGLFRIRRKGVKDLLAPLPPIHLFGGNEVPKALDGASGAHTRRWTFLGFSSFVPQGQYDKDYWDYCFEQEPRGVLRFALQGLEELLAMRGHYLNPESGVEAMRLWQLKSDVVGQFIEDVKEGKIEDKNSTLGVGENLRAERKGLWAAFNAWHQEEFNFAPRMGRTAFFAAMRKKKMVESKIKGVWYINGIGLEVGQGAEY